ncbi:MAG TPA: GNAT family N-acetyltransferase [Methylomirabilota bacterium]|jgi:ribosomal protein S18 acetylase RimI-like enzyme|nr:GNAT family N-acetyltransferase [Methylomirabilota bacterium]
MANALNRTEATLPSAFTPAIVRRAVFGPRPAFRALVAELDGRVVGYTAFGVVYNTDIAGRELWMHDLFVVPRARGRRVGHALVAAVAREAVRRRLPRLGWGVRGTNVRAMRFYRRLGARIGQMRSAVLVGRSLARLADP